MSSKNVRTHLDCIQRGSLYRVVAVQGGYCLVNPGVAVVHNNTVGGWPGLFKTREEALVCLVAARLIGAEAEHLVP